MKRPLNKSITYKTKDTPNDFISGDNGSITGYFATFHHDHGDSYGDVIKPGAFAGTIERRKASGHPFPMCFNHDFNSVIGYVVDIGEDEYGAYFTGKFFPTEKAQEVRNIVKSGAMWQFSFAYDVLEAGRITAGDGTTVNELRELEVFEISIVLVPANPRAVVSDVKSDNRSGQHGKNEKLTATEYESLAWYHELRERTEHNLAEKYHLLATCAEIEKDREEKTMELIRYFNHLSV